MTDHNAPGQQSSNEGNQDKANPTTLEERVAKLELEVAALQSKVATGPVIKPELRSAAPVASSPPDMAWGPARGALHFGSGAWKDPNRLESAEPESDTRESLESRLGSHIFNRIAIVLLLIGTAYFLKLAHDMGWIGPAGWVITGLIAGAALVLWSERFRHKGFAAFSYSLKAVGSGILYLSLWAAFQLYHLLPAPVALALMILVTAWNAMMAWAQDSQLLAVYALAGGFATPMLLSTGGNHEIFLFTYLLGLDIAIVTLVRLKTWTRRCWGRSC